MHSGRSDRDGHLLKYKVEASDYLITTDTVQILSDKNKIKSSTNVNKIPSSVIGTMSVGSVSIYRESGKAGVLARRH